MKKSSIWITLIIAITAICITFIICGRPEMALAALGIIAGAIIIVTIVKGVLGIFY